MEERQTDQFWYRDILEWNFECVEAIDKCELLRVNLCDITFFLKSSHILAGSSTTYFRLRHMDFYGCKTSADSNERRRIYVYRFTIEAATIRRRYSLQKFHFTLFITLLYSLLKYYYYFQIKDYHHSMYWSCYHSVHIF